MEQLQRKYAEVLLKNCLKVEKEQPLFISANIERRDFVRVVAQVAYEIGVKDVYFDLQDPYLKHDALLNLTAEELKKTSMWNKTVWNDYAIKGAAFLMLASETPGLMKDVDPKLVTEMTMYAYNTRKMFDSLRDKHLVPWCIAAVPTSAWAKELFPNEENPENLLWDKIFEVCQIKEENPEKIWEEKIRKLKVHADKLNEYNFKKLIYKNNVGTNFEIELPENHIWASGSETLQNGKEILVNMPTEEVFTSPKRDTANGVVVSSIPLNYQDVLIDEFKITFEQGRAIKVEARQGEEMLKEMIYSCKNADYLGEVALVEATSPIAQSNIVFQETLFDENAACHLALGDSFTECIKDGVTYTTEQLLALGLNKADNHVDFMIGTKDLEITGITRDGEEVKIFEDGVYTKTFE